MGALPCWDTWKQKSKLNLTNSSTSTFYTIIPNHNLRDTQYNQSQNQESMAKWNKVLIRKKFTPPFSLKNQPLHATHARKYYRQLHCEQMPKIHWSTKNFPPHFPPQPHSALTEKTRKQYIYFSKIYLSQKIVNNVTYFVLSTTYISNLKVG